MRSRTTRLTFGAAALIAIGAAVFFLGRSETHLATLAASVRTFDLRARETADALSELRAAQQAYVAAGQGVDFWTGKVAESAGQIKDAIVALRQSARTGRARLVLMEAEAALSDFEAADKRAREYVQAGDHLMAADVIFQEGAGVATGAARQVETARRAEHDGLSADARAFRTREAAALAAAGGVAAVIVLLLVPLAGSVEAEMGPAATYSLRHTAGVADAERRREAGHHRDGGAAESDAGPAQTGHYRETAAFSSRAPSVLQAAADLCTEFGRIRDVEDLKCMLGRTAEIIHSSGLAVWLGNADGADLQPVFTHGYSTHIVAQLPAVPRSAENAVARAYRTGVQQIVRSGPGQTNSAIVAPILTADGCIGALSTEIPGGTEGSEAAQMLTTIIAAHLAGLLASTSAASQPARRAQS
jgi:hypothetical protein